MEQQILSAILASREALDQAHRFKVRETLSDLGKIIFDTAETYYEKDDKLSSLDPDLLKETLALKFPSRAKAVTKVIESLPIPSVANVIDYIKEQRSNQLRLEITKAIGTGRPLSDVKPLISQWEDIEEYILEEEQEKRIYQSPSLEDILSVSDDSNRILVSPKVVNDRLKGGALPQHHIVVFGRPEVGKSAFVINMAVGFLKQNKKVLYVGNEDPAADLLTRFVYRMTNFSTIREIQENKEEIEKILKKNKFDNLVLAETEAGTMYEIESWIKEFSPEVVILDQIRNIEAGGDGRVLQLENAARTARLLGKREQVLVVSVTQAGDSAAGKRVLTMGDVDFSNTGIPGACDTMIGIGMDDELEKQGMRILSFPKNKIGGVKDPVMVTFDGAKARVE